MLTIEDLHVEVAGSPILKGVNLEIKEGETHVLLGPNGGGKTTLLMSIMGLPRYKVTGGKIYFKGEDITSLPPNERAKLGIGIMFQKPPSIRGVKLYQIGEVSLRGKEDGDRIKSYAELLNLTNHIDRDLNYGFSGGELKRSELFQLLCQKPDLVLLDEPESGVDLDNISLIGNVINELLKKEDKVKSRKSSGIIVTHTGYILEYVNADKGHVLMDGRIICDGSPRDLFEEVKKHGYGRCTECL
ncbi:MAG TPA: ABC transporter ATP-binding protein [bacterium]|nr:ABC transporter ATP-binding protein [bacterium]HRU32950.1 ABC transporter ATP-binding protein [bacterium]